MITRPKGVQSVRARRWLTSQLPRVYLWTIKMRQSHKKASMTLQCCMGTQEIYGIGNKAKKLRIEA